MYAKYSKLHIDFRSRLEAQLTNYVDLNEPTIESTQEFLGGIDMIIVMILLQTNATIKDLEIITEKANSWPAAYGFVLNGAFIKAF